MLSSITPHALYTNLVEGGEPHVYMLKRGGLLKMASQRSSRRKHTDGVLTDSGLQGLDIIVDGCCPEFNSLALRESVYTVRQLSGNKRSQINRNLNKNDNFMLVNIKITFSEN